MNPLFCLSRFTDVPPGGFWCECPGTDKAVLAGDFSELVENCALHLESLGQVPPPNLSFLVQDSLCRRLPGYPFCEPCSRVKQVVTFASIIRWVHAMWSFATKHGCKCVEQEAAERRAEICAACPLQVDASGCWGCKGIAGMIPIIIGKRSTSRDAQLKACGKCGCFNSVSVHLPLDVQGSDGIEFPDWCWKKHLPSVE